MKSRQVAQKCVGVNIIDSRRRLLEWQHQRPLIHKSPIWKVCGAPARRGQLSRPQGRPVGSRCCAPMRQLSTAPRLGALGLTRCACQTAFL